MSEIIAQRWTYWCNIWNAVPGKFSLGFSLAVLALEKVIGKKPLPRPEFDTQGVNVSELTCPQTHFRYAKTLHNNRTDNPYSSKKVSVISKKQKLAW